MFAFSMPFVGLVTFIKWYLTQREEIKVIQSSWFRLQWAVDPTLCSLSRKRREIEVGEG